MNSYRYCQVIFNSFYGFFSCRYDISVRKQPAAYCVAEAIGWKKYEMECCDNITSIQSIVDAIPVEILVFNDSNSDPIQTYRDSDPDSVPGDIIRTLYLLESFDGDDYLYQIMKPVSEKKKHRPSGSKRAVSFHVNASSDVSILLSLNTDTIDFTKQVCNCVVVKMKSFSVL